MRAAMIDGGREVLHGAEAEGTMAHHLDLVVHAIQGAVGNSQPGPGQDTVEMGTEHAHEFLEGLEPRPVDNLRGAVVRWHRGRPDAGSADENWNPGQKKYERADRCREPASELTPLTASESEQPGATA